MTQFMRGLALFFLIAGIIGGIMLGFAYPTVTLSKYSFEAATTSFNWTVFVSSVLSSLVLYGVLNSISYGLSLVERIVENTNPIKPEANTLETEKSAIQAQTGHTICKACGEDNMSFEMYCGKCGERL